MLWWSFKNLYICAFARGLLLLPLVHLAAQVALFLCLGRFSLKPYFRELKEEEGHRVLFEAVFTEGCIPTSVAKSRIVTPAFFAVLKQLWFLHLKVGDVFLEKKNITRRSIKTWHKGSQGFFTASGFIHLVSRHIGVLQELVEGLARWKETWSALFHFD